MKARLSIAAAVMVLALVAGWEIRRAATRSASQVVLQVDPSGVMGTVCRLVAITGRDQTDSAYEGLERAEAELRRLEALMSTWIDSSQMSRFNSASAGQGVEMDSEPIEVLKLSHDYYGATSKVFDVTSQPIIALWRAAVRDNIVPSEEDLRSARASSNWDDIRFEGRAVFKERSSTRVDVDGVAKGFAIDKAVEVLQQAGLQGGLVEIGGDLRMFGIGPDDDSWTVHIRSPFENQVWGEIEIEQGAVCSSGDYARSGEVEGHHLSHIIDPRSGRPVEDTPAVTVIARTAAAADAWATALSILGAPGLDLLPAGEGLEAMIVTGGPDEYQVRVTDGFRQRLVRASFDLDD